MHQAKLLFTEVFDQHLAFDVEQKGWCDIAFVELPDGSRVKVFFYDPIRLSQDLENSLLPEGYIAEPGMIVIPRVTREYMEKAVNRLFEQGFFSSFVPL